MQLLFACPILGAGHRPIGFRQRRLENQMLSASMGSNRLILHVILARI
jgi:hypothetical protein